MIQSQSFPTVFPPQNTAIVDDDGKMATPGMAFFRDLFNRTGAGTGIFNQVEFLDASSPQALTTDITVVPATYTSGTVFLVDMLPGESQMIVNRSGNNLAVRGFNATDTIDLAGNTYTLANNKSQIFTCLAIGDLISLQLG